MYASPKPSHKLKAYHKNKSKTLERRSNSLLERTINPLMHNVPNWSDTVCLTILGHYALKG